ncbi:MAG: hypothetical protein FWF15_10870, partial [Oscillospiraceae bacterium]|nr:hypothetical protein [Oscillospiraceae bacterium]
FGGDFIVHPYYRVGVGIMHHESGIAIKEKTISSNTGTYVMAHEYEDVLPDYESLEKIQMPVITLNNEITENRLEFADKIFNGIMPYKKCGYFLNFATWDRIAQYRGVENSLMDLYERPEFIHAMVEKFTQVCESTIDQYEKLNALDTDPYYIGTSPSPTYELPYKDIDKEIITRKDAWVRVMAQMFSTVSPEMHDEFDFRYTQRLFEGFGLSYYGCCEPLDNKIGLMKKRFKNLRKVSITPWANVENAAEQLGSDYILSYKPNPSFVAGVSFDPEPVVAELEHVIKTCLKYNTPLEFILKDISTTGKGNYHNLTQWMETANKVIDKFY